MLKKQQEYWRQRAREEFLQADNEAKAQEELEQNQFDFNKRVREQEWVLKGLASTNDRTMQERLAVAEATKHTRKYGDIDIEAPKQVTANNDKSAKKSEDKKEHKDQSKSWFRFFTTSKSKGDDGSVNTNRKSTGHSVFDDYSVQNVKLRYTLLDGKQEEAHALYEADANRDRFSFLKENYERIIILRRSKTLLNKERQPTHHRSAVEHLPGFNPKKHQCILTEEELDALRCSVPVIPPEPIIETLKPLEQVIAEENAANRHRVGGMHHRYLGTEKLYPLKAFPSTIEVLLPPFVNESQIPEHHLIPNPEEEAKNSAEVNAAKAAKHERRRRIRRIRKDKMDLSRVLVRPTTAPNPLTYPNCNTNPNLIYNEDGNVNLEDNLSGRAAYPLRYTHDPRHKMSEEERVKRRNQQFHWRPKIFVHEESTENNRKWPFLATEGSMQGGLNEGGIFTEPSQDLTMSVVDNASFLDSELDSPLSSPLKAKQHKHFRSHHYYTNNANVTGEESVKSANSSRLGTGKHFQLALLPEDEKARNQMLSTHPDVSRPHTAPSITTPSVFSAPTVRFSTQPVEMITASLPQVVTASSSQEQSKALAMRSDVLASTSLVPGKPLVQIKLPKYSKFRENGRNLKIRGGLSMMSRKTKENLLMGNKPK